MSDATKRLRELEGKATPGPWESQDDDVVGLIVDDDPESGAIIFSSAALFDSEGQGAADTALIAAARNALPFLLDVCEAAEHYRDHEESEPGLDNVGAHVEWESLLYEAQGHLDDALAALSSPPDRQDTT